MRSTAFVFLSVLGWTTWLTPFAEAQTAAPFLMQTTQGTTVQTATDGGTFAFSADNIGIAANGQLVISYTNSTNNAVGSITSVQLVGSTDFSLVGVPDLTADQLTYKGTGLTFSIVYTPSTSQLETAKIVFGYSDGTRGGPSSSTRQGTFTLNLTGVSPEFGFTYLPQPAGNSTLLTNGATAQLSPAALSGTSTTLVVITNKGAGSGIVSSITYSGSSQIALAQVPFPPTTVPGVSGTGIPGTVQFSIIYSPTQLNPVTGTVQINLLDGKGITFSVQGTVQGPLYTYDLGGSPIVPGQTISLPDATIGGTPTTTVVRVRNTGSQNGIIPTLAVSAGTGFTLLAGPVPPIPLNVGSFVTFSIQFTPSQPGQFSAKLQVGTDIFTVQANALGPNLIYSYSAGVGSTTVTSGQLVSFTSAPVGQTSKVQFSVQNTGTADTQINSISVTGPQPTTTQAATFSLSNVAALPLTVPVGATVTFTIVFAPAALGPNTGALRLDAQTFNLQGVGNAPTALPNFSYTGANGTVDAQQQPAVGLSLASPYGLALTGTLTLTFTSEVFANDPAVQFANGGRTTTFTIPAGATQAVFANNTAQLRVQTGTTAGTISITPTFATQTSAIDLTPTNPPALTLTIPQNAPKLLSIAISNKSTNGFTLLVTGYATGRSITQMDFQFTPTQGENVSTTKLTLSVDSNFTAWYGSSASQPYGSLFTASIPFTIQGDIVNTTNISNVVDTIHSVSATLTNGQGVSAAQSVNLQ